MKNFIKVIGIGSSGVNMVDYMYNKGIHGVNFAVEEEFERSAAEVDKLLSDGTKMVFIVTGLDDGTGSGAAPILAEMAKNKGVLTVGIVTIPFLLEKIPCFGQASDAFEEMRKHVDSLIVISNERLKTFYPHFDNPNEALAMTVKSITEIVTRQGIINRDFHDLNYIMKDSGMAYVGYGFGKGENRIENAINEALNSPLLINNDFYDAKRLLFFLSYKKESKLIVEELESSIHSFMERFHPHIRLIWGMGPDESLEEGQEVKFTFIATNL